MLPVQDHLSLQCCQHLATCLQPEHPSYPSVTVDPGPTDVKKTLQRMFSNQVLHFFVDEAGQDAKEARNLLHIEYVDCTIRSRLLNLQPPDIDEEEKSLPRQYRTTLSAPFWPLLCAQRVQAQDWHLAHGCLPVL